MERDGEGRPKIKPAGASEPSAEQRFRRRCYYLGITEPAKVDGLWAERSARLAAEKVKGQRDE